MRHAIRIQFLVGFSLNHQKASPFLWWGFFYSFYKLLQADIIINTEGTIELFLDLELIAFIQN